MAVPCNRRRQAARRRLAAVLSSLILVGALALAADGLGAAPLSELQVAPAASAAGGFLERVRTGREALKARGIEIGTTYIGEVFANTRGGTRRGAGYEGRLDVQVDADLGTLMDLDGLTVHTNAYQFHGTGPSRYSVGNLAVVSSIEALPATRLHELWFEQALFDKAVTLRAGKIAADTEFLVSPTATVFVNSTFGWPVLAANNLPSGGPAAPLATPGIRARWNPGADTTLLLGLFNGDPGHLGRSTLDPQRHDRSGTDFRILGAPFIIAEAAQKYVVPGSGPDLTGVVKVGYFHHFARFSDARFDRFGGFLADPLSLGEPRRARGDDGVYALLDQTLYREDSESDRGLAGFVRLIGSPNAASLVDLYGDAGLVYKGLIPGRPEDVAGLSVAYARLSGDVRGADRDRIRFEGIALPVRRAETVIELTYQAVVAPGFTIQPDLQYILSPGGHTWNPRQQGFARIKDAAIVALRATIQY